MRRATGVLVLAAMLTVTAGSLAGGAAAVLVASPGTREAVARRLGLRGVEIRIGGERPAPTVTTRPGGRLDLGLGERVTLAEARRRVTFPVLLPAAAGFQAPDAVFVDRDRPPGGRVDLVYRARPGLPPSQFTDAGLLVTQFRGRLTDDFIKKVTVGGLVIAWLVLRSVILLYASTHLRGSVRIWILLSHATTPAAISIRTSGAAEGSSPMSTTDTT